MKRRITQRTTSERAVPGGTRIDLFFSMGDVEVPAILKLPDTRPAPAVLLLHGYSSRKETMADGIGAPLLRRGIASLSVDLPMHGAREAGEAAGAMELMKHWRAARAETALAVHYLAARPEIDADRLAIVGYSLGSFLALALAAEEPRLRAVVLAAGGDLPPQLPKLARMAVDPPKLARRLNGRPLLMVHGKKDRTVVPDQARRLFEAANEPKELRWYDAGHYLPDDAAADAAQWLEEKLSTRP
jgi:uncharacterized protein